MRKFLATETINAPPGKIWQVLAEIDRVHEWNPSVTASRYLASTSSGLGAQRHCDIEGGYLRERVVEWEVERKLGFEIFATNAPIRSARATFHLAPHPRGTQVSFEMQYGVKFGPLGALMDRMVMSRQFAKLVPDVLRALKEKIEAGDHHVEPIPPSPPSREAAGLGSAPRRQA
jgi:hypothetical protein